MTKLVWPDHHNCQIPSSVRGIKPSTQRLSVEDAFGTRDTKMDISHLALRLQDARYFLFGPTHGGMVRHKKGQIFKITGVRVDCDTGAIMVDYDLHAKMLSDTTISFSQPLTRFVECGRFVPVYKIERYETNEEAKDRNSGH